MIHYFVVAHRRSIVEFIHRTHKAAAYIWEEILLSLFIGHTRPPLIFVGVYVMKCRMSIHKSHSDDNTDNVVTWIYECMVVMELYFFHLLIYWNLYHTKPFPELLLTYYVWQRQKLCFHPAQIVKTLEPTSIRNRSNANMEFPTYMFCNIDNIRSEFVDIIIVLQLHIFLLS